jgi:hypothetical protein
MPIPSLLIIHHMPLVGTALIVSFWVHTYVVHHHADHRSLKVLIDPGTYVYYNSCMTRNNEPPRYNPGQYSTDLIASNAVGFLDEAIAASDRPFFIGVTPIGPHGEVVINGTVPSFRDPVPAIRHENLFPNVTVPRTPNFNPDVVCDITTFEDSSAEIEKWN